MLMNNNGDSTPIWKFHCSITESAENRAFNTNTNTILITTIFFIFQLENVTTVIEWVNGVAKCPYNPNANITALMTMTGQYYVGSPTDFSGSDPAIYRYDTILIFCRLVYNFQLIYI